jgi:hypothetical protein
MKARMSDGFVEAFQHEVAQEKAEVLGRTGMRLERAVEQLRAHDRGRSGSRATAQRERLLWDLAERVEAFVVQREACGLRDTRYLLEFYDVPREVMARIGARRPEKLL